MKAMLPTRGSRAGCSQTQAAEAPPGRPPQLPDDTAEPDQLGHARGPSPVRSKGAARGRPTRERDSAPFPRPGGSCARGHSQASPSQQRTQEKRQKMGPKSLRGGAVPKSQSLPSAVGPAERPVLPCRGRPPARGLQGLRAGYSGRRPQRKTPSTPPSGLAEHRVGRGKHSHQRGSPGSPPAAATAELIPLSLV